MENSILVSVNDSLSSRVAVDYLTKLAFCAEDWHVTLLHLFRKPSASEELMGKKITEELPDRYRALLEKARDKLIDVGYNPRHIELKLVTEPYPTVADGIIDDAYHETILSSIHYLEIPHVRIHTLVAYIYRLALDGKYRGLVKRFKNERLLSLIDALLQIKWINTINKHFIRMYRNRGKEKKRHSNGLKRIALQGN